MDYTNANLAPSSDIPDDPSCLLNWVKLLQAEISMLEEEFDRLS